MKRSAILLIIAAILSFTSCKQIDKWFGKNNETKEQLYELQEENRELREEIRKDSIRYVQEIEDLRTHYEMQRQAIQEGTSEISANEYNVYYVVVGSFKSSPYAQEYAEKIKSMGYEGKIVEGPNNFKLVTSGTYKSFNAALDPLRDARERLASRSWIYFRK